MTRLIYMFINGCAVSRNNKVLESGQTSDWRLRIVEMPDDAITISDTTELFRSPVCKTKQECQEYKEKFNEERLKKDA